MIASVRKTSSLCRRMLFCFGHMAIADAIRRRARTRLRLARQVIVAGMTIVSISPLAAFAQQALPIVHLELDGHRLTAELAHTAESISRGLMFRTSLPADHGMLFDLYPAAPYCFWMKNTLIPLSIAFIDAKGKVISIQDMQAESRESHCPPAPVRYALEMSQGWFAQQGINKGALLRLPVH